MIQWERRRLMILKRMKDTLSLSKAIANDSNGIKDTIVLRWQQDLKYDISN
jgi:hypothetical protein